MLRVEVQVRKFYPDAMPESIPHYLRVTRALACVSSSSAPAVVLGLSCTALALGIAGCQDGGDDGISCAPLPDGGNQCSREFPDTGADSGDATLRDVTGDAIPDVTNDAADAASDTNPSDVGSDAPLDASMDG
jgi:hypothetical protein